MPNSYKLRISSIAAIIFLTTLSSAGKAATGNPVVNRILTSYQAEGAAEFEAARGESLWFQVFTADKTPNTRSCTSCHGKDLRQSGQHIRTNRAIEPLAPSANPKRLTEEKEIRKWLKRNCKWTLGRECSSQEKGDLLLWIQSQ